MSEKKIINYKPGYASGGEGAKLRLQIFDGNPNNYSEIHSEEWIKSKEDLDAAIKQVKRAALEGRGEYSPGDRLWYILWEENEGCHEASGSFVL